MTDTATKTQPYHPWTTYVAAREDARRMGDTRVGTDRLVLGLLRGPEIRAALGVTLDTAREILLELDRRALGSLGIGLELGVPLLPERAFAQHPRLKAVWKDRVPMTPKAKTALQKAGKPMRRGHHITPPQVLLALLENKAPDPAILLLDAMGIDLPTLRQLLTASAPGA